MQSMSNLESSSDHSRIGAQRPMSVDLVEHLFERLSAILGASMSNVYANAKPGLVKEEWGEALCGFSSAEIKRGLAACRTRKFAPNLGEFLHLCRPSLDAEVAWVEAERGLKAHAAGEPFEWSHPAVYWSAAEFAFEIRASSFAQVRRRWNYVLREEFSRGRWKSIPDPTANRIVMQPRAPASPAEVKKVVQALADVRARLTRGLAKKAEADLEEQHAG